MNIDEQTDAFVMALETLTSRFTREFDLNPYTMAGALEEKKMDLLTNRGVEFESDMDLDEPDDE
jgi:hypothetical protein